VQQKEMTKQKDNEISFQDFIQFFLFQLKKNEKKKYLQCVFIRSIFLKNLWGKFLFSPRKPVELSIFDL
jgi:hypothetical protein